VDRNRYRWYRTAMTRTNMDGKPIRRVLEWLLNRDLTDAEMAAALDMPPANYSRRKEHDDFPNFEELATLGNHFDINSTMLHIAFGLLGTDALFLVDDRGMKQYWEQGGLNDRPTVSAGKEVRTRYAVRADLPGLDRK